MPLLTTLALLVGQLWLGYLWPHAATDDTLESRFAPPAGTTRVAVAADSFGGWLRRLPLKPVGTAVKLFDGRTKPRQDVHAAVVDLDVPPRDLQQCADAVMRLWAEYRYASHVPVVFHPEPGKRTELRFAPASDDAIAETNLHRRRNFERWLIRVFAEAGSASLQAELKPAVGAVEPGDVLIQGGYPGHAILVLDVAADAAGRRWVLLGQSYMPAQDFHVLHDAATKAPWFDAATLDGPGLATPEWRPFVRKDLRRF